MLRRLWRALSCLLGLCGLLDPLDPFDLLDLSCRLDLCVLCSLLHQYLWCLQELLEGPLDRCALSHQYSLLDPEVLLLLEVLAHWI